MQAWEKELKELQDGLYQITATLVATKNGEARAETVQTLLLRPSNGADDVKPLAGLPSREVAAAFLNLSQDQQWNLLTSFWERLKDQTMSAVLKKVAEQPNMNHQMLRDLALRCLYDLDPNEATPIFLGEIKHPHLDNGMFTVKGETLVKPSRFKASWYRALAILGLRRSSVGGFGSFIPETSSAG